MSTYKEGAFDKIRGSGSLYYTPGSEKFKTANTYFLIIENNGKEVSDFDVLVTQNHTVVEVTNGVPHHIVPLKTTFSDERDVSKAFMMKLPKGESELTLQIQPLVTNYIFEVPNAFTPNLDGTNDLLKIIKNYVEIKSLKRSE